MTTEEELKKEIERLEMMNNPTKDRIYVVEILELKAELKGIQEGRAEERKNQYDGICTLCGKPDKFSKSTMCQDCINRWKIVLENKSRAEVLVKLELANKLLIRLYGWGSEKGIIEKYNPLFEDIEIEDFLKSLQEKKE